MQLAAQHVAKARNINGFETRLDKFAVEVCGGLPSTTIWCCLDAGRTEDTAWCGLGTFPLHALCPDSVPATPSRPDGDITLAKSHPWCDTAGTTGSSGTSLAGWLWWQTWGNHTSAKGTQALDPDHTCSKNNSADEWLGCFVCEVLIPRCTCVSGMQQCCILRSLYICHLRILNCRVSTKQENSKRATGRSENSDKKCPVQLQERAWDIKMGTRMCRDWAVFNPWQRPEQKFSTIFCFIEP